MENSINTEKYFQNNLKYLRKSKKLTLFELGDSVNISKSAISDYETGKSSPGFEVVKKLSIFFDISIDDLYNSDIPEIYDKGILKKSKKYNRNDPVFYEIENDKYVFNLNLLNQKLESTKLQLQLIKQLLESREAENKTLRINIKLLEEQNKK